MKRLHVNIAVTELDPTVAFYSSLFAAPPTVLKPDYAKWMLDDPRVNFSVSTRASTKGLDHLGIQVESDDELHEVHDRLKTAGGPILELGETVCCYAKSAKTWISDPDGVAWETFFTTGESAVYGEDTEVLDELDKACGAPNANGENAAMPASNCGC